MGTVELKSDIYKMVDGTKHKQLLRTLYGLLKASETRRNGRLWNALTEEQKNEVLLADEESEDENNLVDSGKVFKRTRRGFSNQTYGEKL